MISRDIIPFTEELGFSRLFQDYVYHPARLLPFFGSPTDEGVAGASARHPFARPEIVQILTRQNRLWKAPETVHDAIDKLSRPDCLTVFTAHQACLFGGPYMILLKALGAVRWARRLEQKLSVPVVPIFWIAGDDHDFKEVAVVDLFDQLGQPVRLTLDWDDLPIYPPVGRLDYDETILREAHKLRDILPDNDFKKTAWDPIAENYRPGGGIVDCFARYVLALIGRFGIPLFNPHDGQVKRMVVPLMQNIVRRRREMQDVLSSTETALTAAGYHVQVRKKADFGHLFYHAPERQPIHYQGDEFQIGTETISERELLDRIEAEPYDFSPDVITRPLVQSRLFPTAAVIGGPAEVAYFAQIMPLFDLFDIARPMIVPRPSMTLIESRFEKLMDRSAASFEEITLKTDEVINRLMEKSFPSDLGQKLTGLAAGIRDQMNELGVAAAAFDPQLKDVAGRTGEKMDYLVNELQKKIFAAHKKKNVSVRDRLTQARDHLFPNRGLAERSIAPVYFISRYGESIIDHIHENLPIGETGHRLLMLSEYYG
ncbi:MAG: bacillithiol biosynthesis cysteine-adding enzyme BshC [candidate division Zixibacteria bacterium]|nr:bacillithiol biosynthesis cysteine-adding enzyme BshC [candidate division Zixibacteria bacterium]